MKPKNLNDISTGEIVFNLIMDEKLWIRILRASQKIGMKPDLFMQNAIIEKLEKIEEQMKEGK